MTSYFSRFGLSIAASGLSTTIAIAAAHDHGAAQLALVLTNAGELSVSLEIPAGDVLGFEHAPTSAAEAATLDKALATPRDVNLLFDINASASCSLLSAAAVLEPNESHAALVYNYTYHCANAGEFSSLSAHGIFGTFVAVTEISVAGILNGEAVQSVLTASSPIASLR